MTVYAQIKAYKREIAKAGHDIPYVEDKHPALQLARLQDRWYRLGLYKQ